MSWQETTYASNTTSLIRILDYCLGRIT